MQQRAGIFILGLMLTAALPAASQTPDTVRVEINALAGIRYDRVRFQVPPGAPVKVTFNNRDEDSDMDHNLVFTRPGARMEVVVAGMQAGVERNYVPGIPAVMASTPQLKRGESFVLVFTAPAEPGVYPYACTFPGHGYTMYGAMYVGQPMPQLALDENVPPTQRTGTDLPLAGGPRGPGSGRPAPTTGPALSYGTTFPAVSRTFMPESGPASIAVGFEDGQSYNFDAGEGFLRYAWKGGFVNNWPHWEGNGNAYAVVNGEIFFRNTMGVPLRFGDRDRAGKVNFRGYSLDAERIPEFRYDVDGAAVVERIEPRSGGGFTRTFRITTTEPVRFLTQPDDGVRYTSSTGRWQDGVLTLTAAQAREFTLLMVPRTEGGDR